MSELLKYHPRLTLGELEMALNNDEQWWGGIKSMGSADNVTIAELEEPYPDVKSLMLMPLVEGVDPPEIEAREFICDGEVFVTHVKMRIGAYRKSG